MNPTYVKLILKALSFVYNRMATQRTETQEQCEIKKEIEEALARIENETEVQTDQRYEEMGTQDAWKPEAERKKSKLTGGAK